MIYRQPVLATYMPGSSGRTLPQHQVRDCTLWLITPFQRRSVVQSKVTVGEQQWVKEHSHGIGWSALQPFAQVLQILKRQRATDTVRQCSHCKQPTVYVRACVLPAPTVTGEAAPPVCCAAVGWGAMPQVTGRGCNLTTGMTDRSPMGHYLRNRGRGRQVRFSGTARLL